MATGDMAAALTHSYANALVVTALL
jgi:hypothetical protein